MVSSAPDFKKIALRAAMRRRRRLMAVACPDAARRAADGLPLARLPAFRRPGSYHPIGTELDPSLVYRRLQAGEGGRILPVVVDRRRPLLFRLARDGAHLAPDAVGIPSPTSEAEEVEPDLIIVPLLAFDRRGGRLGQGAGHYDRTIAALRARGPLFVLGLAYSGQEVGSVPREAHDQRLDAILTETGYIGV